MDTIAQMQAVLEVFAEVAPDGKLSWVAEHDQIWVGPQKDVEWTTEQHDRLESAGLFWDEETSSWSIYC